MAGIDGTIYGRNGRTSIRFFWIAVAVCLVAVTAFFAQVELSDSSPYLLGTDLHLALLATVVLVTLVSAVANAYLEGGFVITVLNATAVALGFGLATFLSFVTDIGVGADAPPVLVFVTFAVISAFGGVLAWGVGNALRGLESGSGQQ